MVDRVEPLEQGPLFHGRELVGAHVGDPVGTQQVGEAGELHARDAVARGGKVAQRRRRSEREATVGQWLHLDTEPDQLDQRDAHHERGEHRRREHGGTGHDHRADRGREQHDRPPDLGAGGVRVLQRREAVGRDQRAQRRGHADAEDGEHRGAQPDVARPDAKMLATGSYPRVDGEARGHREGEGGHRRSSTGRVAGEGWERT